PPYQSNPLAFFFLLQHPPTSTLFPYTTLFRSHPHRHRQGADRRHVLQVRHRRLPTDGRRRRQRQQLRRHSAGCLLPDRGLGADADRKSTRLNSSHLVISYAVFCLKKKKTKHSV